MFLMVLTAACAVLPVARVAAPNDSLGELHRGGRTWAEFFEAAKARKDTWRENFERGAPDSALAVRAQAVPGSWKLLAVAEDWCGDSANTVPYLARLAELVPGLELRIVDSKKGRWVMEQHRTDDGRAATPTILLLDANDAVVGTFVERPAPLRAWVAEHKPKLSDDDFQAQKTKWYREDRGYHTVLEIVELLEAAAQRS
jgi:hypothetical protein